MCLFLIELLNELSKGDKVRGLPGIYRFFCKEFNNFNNTGTQILDSIDHMSLKLTQNHILT